MCSLVVPLVIPVYAFLRDRSAMKKVGRRFTHQWIIIVGGVTVVVTAEALQVDILVVLVGSEDHVVVVFFVSGGLLFAVH